MKKAGIFTIPLFLVIIISLGSTAYSLLGSSCIKRISSLSYKASRIIDHYRGQIKSSSIAHITLKSHHQKSLTKNSFLRSSSSEVIVLDDGEGSIDNRESEVRELLRNVIEPEKGDDIVALGFIKLIEINRQGDIALTLEVSGTGYTEEIRQQCSLVLSTLEWVSEKIEISIQVANANKGKAATPVAINSGGAGVNEQKNGLVGVKDIIAVSSCKGGVGKSTVSVNLAYTLSRKGFKVGILDADIYGPSLPTMTKPSSTDLLFAANMIKPLEFEGVKLMSMGYLNKGASIMRGPMVNQILNQFVSLTDWGDLDYLIVDMPPGTGDIQLTLAQIMNITAAVIVTTPQRLSFVDVVKGIDLFDTVSIPCVAVVENMAAFNSYDFSEAFYKELGEKAASVALASTALSQNDPSKAFSAVTKCLREAIESQRAPLRVFGGGYNQRLRDMWGIENLISLPLEESISSCGDNGSPYVLQNPLSSVARAIEGLADSVIKEIGVLNEKRKNNEENQQLAFDPTENVLTYLNVRLSPKALRTKCRCAVCVEEFSGRQLLNPSDVSESVRPLSMAPIGRYAVSVDWSDGHKSLYPFRQILDAGK